MESAISIVFGCAKSEGINFEWMTDNKIVQKKYYNEKFEAASPWKSQAISANTKYLNERFINLVVGKNVQEVLEIGCGNGLLTFFLLKKPLRITAIDIAEKAIECMEKQFAEAVSQGKLRLQCADIIEFMEQANEKYDAIIGSGIIHHVEKKNWNSLFRAAYKSLKPGGIFACGPEPNAGGLYRLAWPCARLFYRFWGMDYDEKVEKGTREMIPKNLKLELKKAGWQNPEILPFQVIPHFNLRLLEYLDRKLSKHLGGAKSFYIIVRGKK